MNSRTAAEIASGIDEAWALLDSFTTEQLFEQCLDAAMHLGKTDDLFSMEDWGRKRLVEWWILNMNWDPEDKCWRTALNDVRWT